MSSVSCERPKEIHVGIQPWLYHTPSVSLTEQNKGKAESMWLSSPSRERPLPWYFLNMEITHFPTLVTPCVALLSYSLSPWQAGMQTARWGPKWESSLFIVREMGLANCRRIRREIMGLWSLSTRHPAGKMQGLASASVGAWAPLGLSTFHQARALLSPSPPCPCTFA